MTCDARSTAGLFAIACALALSACSMHEDGITVQIGVTRAAQARASDAGQTTAAAARSTLVTDSDETVHFDHAYVVLSRVELLACTTASRRTRIEELLGPSIAYAHGISSPTVWAVPTVLDLLDDSAHGLPVARMQPPPGEYCAARITLDQADADAVNLPTE